MSIHEDSGIAPAVWRYENTCVVLEEVVGITGNGAVSYTSTEVTFWLKNGTRLVVFANGLDRHKVIQSAQDALLAYHAVL